MGFLTYLAAICMFNAGVAGAALGEWWGLPAAVGGVWLAVGYSRRHPA